MSPERKHDRIPITRKMQPIPATFETLSVRGEGHIESLSLEGLFFASEIVPRVGELVTVIFPDHSGNKIEVGGTVRSTTAQGRVGGFGIQLESPTDEYLEFYEELLTR